MLNKRREGFTLIELLIVIVIIGILAAIAIPKFGATREQAYFKAMMSDLRNLQAQQELYYAAPHRGYSYAATVGNLPDCQEPPGVNVTITAGDNGGWSATAVHDALPNLTPACAVFVGDVATYEEAPATDSGVVACDE